MLANFDLHDHLGLMERRVQTLYRLDAAGRLLTVNELDGPTAPRLAIGRTLAGMIWRFRHDLPAAVARPIDELLASEPPPRDLRKPPQTLARVRDILATHAPLTHESFGPAWYCPAHLAQAETVIPRLVTASADLLDTFPELAPELDGRQPCLAVREDGAVVTVCFSSRNGVDAAEAGLETLAAFRGRGYAVAAVAAWAAAVRQSGRLPLYSTSWDNLASQGVARKLGLVLYGADVSLL